MILRVLRSSAVGIVLATVVLALALVFRPVKPELALDGYVLLVGGMLLLSLVEAATSADGRRRRRSPFEHALSPPQQDAERPAEIARSEREVVLGTSSAFYLHYRLRPMLRKLAEQRLADRHAVDLDDPRPEVRATLPDEAWELIHSERRPPRDRHGPGIPLRRLSEIVDALERI